MIQDQDSFYAWFVCDAAGKTLSGPFESNLGAKRYMELYRERKQFEGFLSIEYLETDREGNVLYEE